MTHEFYKGYELNGFKYIVKKISLGLSGNF